MRIGIQLRQHHTELIGRIQITGRPFLAIRFHILQGTFRTTVQATELVDHRRHTHPDTDGNLQTTPGIRKQLRYLCRDHPPDNGCPCLVAIPDKQHELIATEAQRNIVHPDTRLQNIRHLTQDHIGKNTALFLIDPGKIIHIQNHQRTDLIHRLGIHNLPDHPQTGFTRVKSRQRIP